MNKFMFRFEDIILKKKKKKTKAKAPKWMEKES